MDQHQDIGFLSRPNLHLNLDSNEQRQPPLLQYYCTSFSYGVEASITYAGTYPYDRLLNITQDQYKV